MLKKTICIPSTPPVEIGEFLPLIDHPLFQALRGRKQLGVNDLIFPGAQHSRFEHALGVLSLTQRLCRLQQLGGEDGRLLQAFALLHDIGHGPFSHQIEPVLSGDHHRNGLALLQEMGEALALCGVSLEALAALLEGGHPLGAWVSDRNLGTDKLDYLRRDALHIGFHGIPDIEKLQFFTIMTPLGLAVEEKYIEDVKQLQKFYSYLHQHGYLNKTALSAQRLLQRAVQEALLGGAAAEGLWRMTDRQLLGWLEGSMSPVSRELTRRLAERRLHRTFLCLKVSGYGFVEKHESKQLLVREWSRADLHRFSQSYLDVGRLRQLEDALAGFCGLAPGEVLCAAMPYFTKLIPRDVRVSAGSQRSDYWLLEHDKDHSRSLESDYLRTFAVRVLATPEKREMMCARAAEVDDFLRQALA